MREELLKGQAGLSILTAVWRRGRSGSYDNIIWTNTFIELNYDRAGCKEGAATLKGAQGDVFSFTYSQDVMAGPSRY